MILIVWKITFIVLICWIMGILIDVEDNQFSDISSGKEWATEVDLTSDYLKTKNKLAEFVTK